MNAENDNQVDLEDSKKVVITPEDSKECEKFFEFFEIPMSEELKKAYADFQREPTFAHQEELKFWLANELSNSTHPVFQDEVFAQVIPETKEVRDELLFEREFEQQITSSANEE